MLNFYVFRSLVWVYTVFKTFIVWPLNFIDTNDMIPEITSADVRTCLRITFISLSTRFFLKNLLSLNFVIVFKFLRKLCE